MPAVSRLIDFRTCVRSLCSDSSSHVAQATILAPLKKALYTDPFHTAAKSLLKGILSMQGFVTSQRGGYLSHGVHLMSGASGMSDAQRDELDSEVTQFIRSCSSNIDALKKRIGLDASSSEHQLAHQHTVVITLHEHLEAITTATVSMRKKRMVQLKEQAATQNLERAELDRVSGQYQFDDSDEDDEFEAKGGDGAQAQMFEAENESLLANLEDKLDEVKRAEKSLVEISQLMGQFHSKLQLQNHMIDSIYDNGVSSLGHLREGHDQLGQALDRGGSYRVGILFFFIVASLSLLFLDWYY
jgi:syntaxin 18